MKIQITPLIVLILLALNLKKAEAQTINLAIEPNHSTIGFVVPIAGGVTRVTGKFTDFMLDMDYVDNDLTKSSVLFTIQAKSINTGIGERDEHLRSSDFFDVVKYPEIIFESDVIRKTGDTYEVEGDFSMHGVTRRVTIPFRLTGDNPSRPSVQIRWSLNREDYNIFFEHTSEKHFLSKKILIEIDFWTKKGKKK